MAGLILDENNRIVNIIVCNDDILPEFGAVPSYEGARIGDPYGPPPPPDPPPTLEERVGSLEKGKADQQQVDELNEALNMILTGVTV